MLHPPITVSARMIPYWKRRPVMKSSRHWLIHDRRNATSEGSVVANGMNGARWSRLSSMARWSAAASSSSSSRSSRSSPAVTTTGDRPDRRAAFDQAIDSLAEHGPLFHVWLEPGHVPHHGDAPDRPMLRYHSPTSEGTQPLAQIAGHGQWLAPVDADVEP